MSRALFNVTYEIVTPESAADGDAAERGFIAQGLCLREAFKLTLATRTAEVDGSNGCETDGGNPPRWITQYNGAEFRTGAHESRSLHIPDSVSASSARRIARLMGVRS